MGDCIYSNPLFSYNLISTCTQNLQYSLSECNQAVNEMLLRVLDVMNDEFTALAWKKIGIGMEELSGGVAELATGVEQSVKLHFINL